MLSVGPNGQLGYYNRNAKTQTGQGVVFAISGDSIEIGVVNLGAGVHELSKCVGQQLYYTSPDSPPTVKNEYQITVDYVAAQIVFGAVTLNELVNMNVLPKIYQAEPEPEPKPAPKPEPKPEPEPKKELEGEPVPLGKLDKILTIDLIHPTINGEMSKVGATAPTYDNWLILYNGKTAYVFS